MFFDCPPDQNTNSVKVKICGLRSALMAKWAVAAGADAIGLMFYKPSPRCVTFNEAAKLSEAVKGQADIVGVFVNPTKDEVKEAIQKSGLTGLQFHGDESVDFCTQWDLPWLKAIHVDGLCDIESEVDRWRSAFACLLDTKLPSHYGGSGKTFDWSCIPNNRRSSIVLSGGLHSGNVAEALSDITPFALDVSSGVEVTRGQKSQALITAFMHEVQNVRKNKEQ